MNEDEAYRLHRQASELYLKIEDFSRLARLSGRGNRYSGIALRAYERVCRRRDKMQVIRNASKPTTPLYRPDAVQDPLSEEASRA